MITGVENSKGEMTLIIKMWAGWVGFKFIAVRNCPSLCCTSFLPVAYHQSLYTEPRHTKLHSNCDFKSLTMTQELFPTKNQKAVQEKFCKSIKDQVTPLEAAVQ